MSSIRTLNASDYPTSDLGAWVYFIQEGDDGPIKIGHAWRIADRLRGAQTGNPRELRLIGAIYVADRERIWKRLSKRQAKRLEGSIHKRFSTARIRGEWFEPVEPLLHYIASLSGDAS